MSKDPYKDGYRDATHGGDRNRPNGDGWGAFKTDKANEENRQYDRGYDGGESAKKNR